MSDGRLSAATILLALVMFSFGVAVGALAVLMYGMAQSPPTVTAAAAPDDAAERRMQFFEQAFGRE